MKLLVSWWLGVLVASAPAWASTNRGDEVIVVYNSRLKESKALAEYYQQRRHVPANQVFGFDLSTSEEVSRAEFRDLLEKPLAKAIDKQNLWRIASNIIPATNGQPSRVEWTVVESKIRYAVLCYGIPLRIAPEPDLKEEGTEKLRPEMRRNEAAVDSELALLPLIEQKLPLAGPLRNPLYGVTNAAELNPTNGVLMVARLDGPAVEIARGLVDKALEAETNSLWGRAYFDLRNTTEPGYKLGDDWIRNAAEISRRLGFETVVDENPGTFPAGFPMRHIALYEGWYDENVSGPFLQPTVEFMPGAFAYHLHSFSAATLRSTNRCWVGPLLAKGATITMGCVYEPYLTGTPDLAVFTSRLLFSGFTFGEAAVASQPVLSWQTTVVGDPLYRPFGMNLDDIQKTLLSSQNKLADWYYLRLVNINLVNGKPLAACVELLEQLPLTRQSAVLAEKLGNLYSAQGKPSSAAHQYAQALKLEPSPQQRLRLLLTLGDQLVKLQREAEAYEAYESILKAFPDYAQKISLYRQMLPLAQKLNKKDDAGKLQAALESQARPGK